MPRCGERGYLLIPAWLEHMGRGDFEAGYVTALEAAEIGARFGDADLVWLARDDQARALTRLRRIKEALRLVDEALVAASANDLSPIVTSIAYCNTIAFCRTAYEVRHVREWTLALTRWCERQPEMVAHDGLCLVLVCVHNISLVSVLSPFSTARSIRTTSRPAESCG